MIDHEYEVSKAKSDLDFCIRDAESWEVECGDGGVVAAIVAGTIFSLLGVGLAAGGDGVFWLLLGSPLWLCAGVLHALVHGSRRRWREAHYRLLLVERWRRDDDPVRDS